MNNSNNQDSDAPIVQICTNMGKKVGLKLDSFSKFRDKHKKIIYWLSLAIVVISITFVFSKLYETIFNYFFNEALRWVSSNSNTTPSLDITKKAIPNLEITSKVGDTIGGTTAPIIGFISAILVYFAFRQQIKANKLTQDQFALQSFSEVLKQMIENYKKNIEKGFTVVIPQSRRKIVKSDEMIIKLHSFWDEKIHVWIVWYKNQNPTFPVDQLINNHLSRIKIAYYDEYRVLAEYSSLSLSIFAFTYSQTKQIKDEKTKENYIDIIYWLFWNVLALAERELTIEVFIIYFYEKRIDKNRKEILRYFIEFMNKKDKDVLDSFVRFKPIYGNIIKELLL